MSDLKVRPLKALVQPGLAVPHYGGKLETAALLLFEPFVEMDAFGIFPGGAGQVMEVARENFGVDAEEPVGNLARACLRSRAGGTFPGRRRRFFGLIDPARFKGLVIDLLKIHESEAIDGSGELRACGLECWRERRRWRIVCG
jgi:hypothetical protein